MIKNTIIFFLLLSTILCTIECIPFLTFFLFSVLLFLLFLSRSRGGIGKYYLFFLLIFLRLFFFQYNFSEDIKKLDCGQNRQDIDSHYSNQITLSGTLYKNTSNKNFTIHTLFGKFTLTSYTPIHYEDGSIIAIQGTITCFHSPIIPFSYESLLIARGYRGVIQLENTTLLSSNKHPLSISFPHVALDSKSDGIPEGIIFGDTSFLSSSLYNLFLDSGLVYLISASGGNIALLITLVTYIFFFLPYTYRRGVLFICILLYSYVLGENLAFLRAFLTYTISQLVFPKKYYISSLRIIRITFLSLLLYNPYFIISSRGILLSISGVLGISYTPLFLKKHKILSLFVIPLRSFIALSGPLLFLTHHINIYTVFLSILATPVTSMISVLYITISIIPLLQNIGGIYLLQFFSDILYNLASRGSLHGIFISLTAYPFSISIIIRIISWIGLFSLYKYTSKKYFEK